MEYENEIRIRGEGMELLIGLPSKLPSQRDEEDWVVARVTGRIWPHHFDFDMNVRWDTLMRLKSDLESAFAALAGSPKFVSDEENLRIEWALGALGDVTLHGEIRNEGITSTVLSFSCHSDQTYIQPILDALRSI